MLDVYSQGVNSSALDSLTNLRAQKLVTSHEATRLVNLSENLKALAHKKNLTPYEREREYEKCLEEFRRLQEIVLRYGIRMQPAEKTNATIAHEDRLRTTIRDELITVLRSLLQSSKTPATPERQTTLAGLSSAHFTTPSPPTAPNSPSSTSTTTTTTTTVQSKSDGDGDGKTFDISEEATSDLSGDTSLDELTTDADDEDGDDKGTPEDNFNEAYVLEMLKKQGLQNVNDRVFFNNQQGYFKMPYDIFLPNKRGYAESSFRKAMDFLFNLEQQPMPGRSGIDVVIYNIIQGLKSASKKDFSKLLKKYRNLKAANDYFKSMGTRKAWLTV